ncbi:FtsX-like permease family protein [Alkaliphilus sp. B6464]|uniref:FtsX-like permease family protein n=1 Tax=Alkaliphilus sp. B6464 TaxID=2731219 RepID=UPI001BABB20F|nr:ABC transporter permease [Alkaliphilus sp. B6464]QUH19467.1 ABC transporter permease [Alkaliphilus sp. B6464]
MYIFQNAFRNVLRNRGRNILIGTIIFAVIITSVIALMISNTTSQIIDDYKSRFGAEITLQPDMQKIRDEAMANSTDGRVMVRIPTIPADQLIAFGESEYLQDSVYTASSGVNSESITPIDAELGGGSGIRMMGGSPDIAMDPPMQFMMNLFGNKFTEFEEGMRELAEGRMPQEMNECIISTDLAEANGIQLGDTLPFYSELRNMQEGVRADTSYELTVVGTYYDVTDEYSEGSMRNAFTNRRNEILTNYETVVQEIQPDMTGIKVEAKYYLKEPGMLDAFAEEVYAKGLAKTFNVTTDEVSYSKIVGPVEGLKGIAVTFMIVVLIFGGIIIALLSSIAIRERKYEIGVLRAMGMKKHKVAFGLWSEMLIITCLCLLLGLGAGSLAAQPITNALLANQIEAAEAVGNAQGNGGGMMMPQLSSSSSNNAEPLSNIDISLAPNTIIQIIALALLLASLAGFASVGRITKYEPIKILMERN